METIFSYLIYNPSIYPIGRVDRLRDNFTHNQSQWDRDTVDTTAQLENDAEATLHCVVGLTPPNNNLALFCFITTQPLFNKMPFSVFRAASLRNATVAPLRRTATQAPNCIKVLFRSTLNRK
jgi:hypothetical protein